MPDQKIGKVIHYYDKIGVAVIGVEKGQVKVGDLLHFSHGNRDFYQNVSSLQVDHKQVEEIKPGEEAGMKVDSEVKQGDDVFIVIE